MAVQYGARMQKPLLFGMQSITIGPTQVGLISSEAIRIARPTACPKYLFICGFELDTIVPWKNHLVV
ncbi:hypothetical protein A0H81_14480 [Grifola frondosa]|uniref:Uncharacterized protein n=1 Tax=Grifola frondosa TaxID=5627 RepID=A0A1C7LMU4_GRIFR|nr:hypothetical protein A0H81_14480 [Grifola frondosa]